MSKKPSMANDGYRPEKLTEGYQPLQKGYQPSSGQSPPKPPSSSSSVMKPSAPPASSPPKKN